MGKNKKISKIKRENNPNEKSTTIDLYTQYDIDVIADNIDMLVKEADKVVKTNYEPTIDEFKSVVKAIKEFIKSKDRIVYGGSALNTLIKHKNPKDGIYDDFKKADYEFYSPEPIKDLKDLCDSLHAKKFKDIQGVQAQHGDSYKVFSNFEDVSDISYVPTYIYNKMPTIKIDGIRYIHPKFMYVDFLRMYTDPLMSFRILKDKAFPRGMLLLKYYPLEVGKGKISYDELPTGETEIIKEISKIVTSDSFMHVGTYALQFYTINKDKKLLPFEVISVDYDKDVKNIYQELSKNYKITVKEYFPFFQFLGRHIEFIHNDKVVLTVFSNNDRCVPYRKYESGNIASFQQVLLHQLTKYYYNYINKLDYESVNNVLGELIKVRNEYLKKNNKSVMDDTIYRDFMIKCLGKAFDERRQSFLDMKKKRDQGKQIKYRYNPQTDYDIKLPEYIFDNVSGNLINNPRLQTIKVSTESSEEEPTETNESPKETSDAAGDLPQMVARNVKKFESETKYPFLETDYVSEAY